MYYASTIAVFNDKKEILIIKRSDKADSYPGYWGLPGGKIEQNESPVQTAARELKEEVNLDVDIKDLTFLYNIKRSPDKEILSFVAENWTGNIKLNPESTDYQWIDPADLFSVNLVPTPAIFVKLLEMWSDLVI